MMICQNDQRSDEHLKKKKKKSVGVAAQIEIQDIAHPFSWSNLRSLSTKYEEIKLKTLAKEL